MRSVQHLRWPAEPKESAIWLRVRGPQQIWYGRNISPDRTARHCLVVTIFLVLRCRSHPLGLGVALAFVAAGGRVIGYFLPYTDSFAEPSRASDSPHLRRSIHVEFGAAFNCRTSCVFRQCCPGRWHSSRGAGKAICGANSPLAPPVRSFLKV